MLTRKRRAIWIPNSWSRGLAWFSKFGSSGQTTFRRALFALVLFPIALYLFNQVFTTNAIIIEPFSVPKRYEDAGVTPEAMSRMIGDALNEIEDRAHSVIAKKDLLGLSSDENPVPEIEIPGFKLGLRTLVDAGRQIFHREPTRVSGGILVPLTAELEMTGTNADITLRIVASGYRLRLLKTTALADDPLAVARKAAETILHQVNPYLLGCFWEETDDYEAVITIAKEILENAGEQDTQASKRAYLLWGLALDDERNYAEAIRLYIRATQLDPKFASAYVNWGVALISQGSYTDAVPLFRKATQLDPRNALAYSDLSWVLARLGRYAEAIPVFEKATRLDPDPYAYNNWGWSLINLGRYSEAIPVFEKASRRDPTDVYAYNNWGWSLINLGKYAEAIPLFEKATQLDPKYTLAYNNWANALDHQGKGTEATVIREKTATLDANYTPR